MESNKTEVLDLNNEVVVNEQAPVTLDDVDAKIMDGIISEHQKAGLDTPLYDIIYKLHWNNYNNILTSLSKKGMSRVMKAFLELNPTMETVNFKSNQEKMAFVVGYKLLEAKALKMIEDTSKQVNKL